MLVKLVVAIIFINLLNINTKAMSLSPWFGTGGGSLFDPLRAWDPLMDNTGWGRASDPLSLSTDIPRSITTRVDWRETDKAHVFTIDTPGLKREEIKVEVEEPRTLRISGEFKKEKVEDNDVWHRVERREGSFLRRFRLPDNANVEQIKATMNNGVLSLTVPKTEQPTKEHRRIDIT